MTHFGVSSDKISLKLNRSLMRPNLLCKKNETPNSCSLSNYSESTQRGRGSYPLLFDLQPLIARHPNSLRSDMDASSTGAEGSGVKGFVF